MFGNVMGLLAAILSDLRVIVRWRRKVDMLPVLVLSSVFIIVSGAIVTEGPGVPLWDIVLCLLWGGVLSGFANWMFIVASRQ